jgi:hypothetical protein
MNDDIKRSAEEIAESSIKKSHASGASEARAAANAVISIQAVYDYLGDPQIYPMCRDRAHAIYAYAIPVAQQVASPSASFTPCICGNPGCTGNWSRNCKWLPAPLAHAGVPTESTADAAIARLNALTTAGMELSANLCRLDEVTIKGTDYLRRDSVMNEVVDWRGKFDAAPKFDHRAFAVEQATRRAASTDFGARSHLQTVKSQATIIANQQARLAKLEAAMQHSERFGNGDIAASVVREALRG